MIQIGGKTFIEAENDNGTSLLINMDKVTDLHRSPNGEIIARYVIVTAIYVKVTDLDLRSIVKHSV